MGSVVPLAHVFQENVYEKRHSVASRRANRRHHPSQHHWNAWPLSEITSFLCCGLLALPQKARLVSKAGQELAADDAALNDMQDAMDDGGGDWAVMVIRSTLFVALSSLGESE